MNPNKPTIDHLHQMSINQLKSYLITSNQRLPTEDKPHSYYLNRAIELHTHASTQVARRKKRMMSLSSATDNILSTPKNVKQRRHSTIDTNTNTNATSIKTTISKSNANTPTTPQRIRSQRRRTVIPHRKTSTTQSPNAYVAIRKKRERVRRSTMEPISIIKKNIVQQKRKKYKLEKDPKSMTIMQLRTWLQDHNIQYEVSGYRNQYYIDLVIDHSFNNYSNESGSGSSDQLSPPPTKRHKATPPKTIPFPLPSNLQKSPLTPEYLRLQQQAQEQKQKSMNTNVERYDFPRTSSEQMRREIQNLLKSDSDEESDDPCTNYGKVEHQPPPPYIPPSETEKEMHLYVKKEKQRRKSYEPQSEVKSTMKKKRRRKTYSALEFGYNYSGRSFLDTNEVQINTNVQQIPKKNVSTNVSSNVNDVPSAPPMPPMIEEPKVIGDKKQSWFSLSYFSNTVIGFAFITAAIASVGKWYSMNNSVLLFIVGVCSLVFGGIWYVCKQRKQTADELRFLKVRLYDILKNSSNFRENAFSAMPVKQLKQYLHPSSNKIWKRFVCGIGKDRNIQKSIRMIDGLQQHCWNFSSAVATMSVNGRGGGMRNENYNSGQLGSIQERNFGGFRNEGREGNGQFVDTGYGQQQRNRNQTYWV